MRVRHQALTTCCHIVGYGDRAVHRGRAAVLAHTLRQVAVNRHIAVKDDFRGVNSRVAGGGGSDIPSGGHLNECRSVVGTQLRGRGADAADFLRLRLRAGITNASE